MQAIERIRKTFLVFPDTNNEKNDWVRQVPVGEEVDPLVGKIKVVVLEEAAVGTVGRGIEVVGEVVGEEVVHSEEG